MISQSCTVIYSFIHSFGFLVEKRHFTTIYGIEIGARHDSMIGNCCMCVSVPNFHFSSSFLVIICLYLQRKNLKNGQECHFDVILLQKMILNDDELVCIYAWMCVSARQSLFAHCFATAAVFYQRTVKNAFFTAFYSILRHKMILNDDELPCIYAWMCLCAR